MTLNQLRYFRVLAKTEHYTKAADALAISQPSLSRAIALLEEELGVLLFHPARAQCGAHRRRAGAFALCGSGA